MLHNVYAVRDKLAGFGAPILDQSDALAKRNFAVGLRRAGNSDIAADLDLFLIGTFDSDSGTLSPCLPSFVISGGDALSAE